ncbi:glycine betaine ABC transporter substrate-binding protein [Streptomyces sp. HNM0574]|uniref:glycine betaine ABC transporter substrate-binding protein n=1 Tax=Streptomyces sp. HNM0574 TaxID=2714954 RepID=UPI001469EC0A|nr:glycine betaine ABC transporter substrate-binding protein [Streptomyces sp. HNM0574]NLU66815.1 glycine/betaine ABC transporter substrate-binding protein [Streptomyces sp. HNM0574]
MRTLRIRKGKAFLAATSLLLLTACGGGEASSGADKSVVLTVPTWAGGEANAAVAKYLLEHELGYDVTLKKMDEADAWKAIGTGKADAILEDWGRKEERRTWVDKKGTVVPAGSLGITGKMGWYVPSYLAAEHKDITDWKKLNRYAELFAKDGSGKGELLEGSREFLTHDEELIDNLRLNYEPSYAGSEKAQLKEIRERAAKREPFLAYWWQPHWIGAEVELTEVRLPAYYDGCAGEDVKKVTCGYPEDELKKYLNADFSKNGGDAAEMLRNFQWSEDDQNKVAKRITDDGITPEGAAKEWVEDNRGTWKMWLWGLDGE